MKLKFWERFKGFWSKGTSTIPRATKFHIGEKTWSARCRYFDKIVNEHPLAKAQILTIAGQLMAEGIFVEPAQVGDPHKGRAEEAKDKCDLLNADIGLDVLLFPTAVTMAKYGSCFWEKTWSPKFDVRIIPQQETIEPMRQSATGDITEWRQVGWGGKTTATWLAEEIVHFPWNVTSISWPYGTSSLVGLDAEFKILEQLETDLKEHMHKTAFPNEAIQVGDKDYMPTDDEVTSIRTDVKNWEPGERFVTSYPLNRIEAGTGGNRISDLHEVLDFLKDQCIDGLMVPPISKQWSSTMASAKEMMPWARANLIRPMQRIIRRKVEREVYRPYLEDLGFSVKVTPKLKWEPPDAHMDERAEMYAVMVTSGIITPEVAAEELGYGDKLEEMKQQRLEKHQQQMEQTQLQTKFASEDSWKKKQLKRGKSYLVTEVDEDRSGGSSR